LVVGDLIPAAPPWTSDGPASRADARHARRPRGQHQHGPCRGVPAFLPSAIVAQLNDPARVRCLGRKHHRSRGAGYRWMATGRNQPRPVCGRQRLPQSLARSVGSVSWSCRTGLHTRNPTAWLRGCRRCKPAKCGNKTGRNRKYAWSRPTTVPTTVRRKTGSIRSIEARAVASPDSSTLLHQQWEWDFLGKQ
jgi:hypothetical protein